MILDQTDLSLELLLAGAVAANEAQFVANWVDVTTTAFTPGMTHGVTNGATAVTAVAAPGASTQRQAKSMYVYNADTASITLTVRLNHNNTDYRIVWKGVLATGQMLGYTAKQGFIVSGSDGTRNLTSPSYAFKSRKVIFPHEQEFLNGVPGLAMGVAHIIQLTADTAYWNYIGYVTKSFLAHHVYFYMSTAGTGAQAAEVALVSSANPPNKANQTLTKLVATGVLETLLATAGRKYSRGILGYRVPCGIHLWVGLRTEMATTQPRFYGISQDYDQGQILSTAAAGALTGAGPWTGSIIAQTSSGSVLCPLLGVSAQRGSLLR